ncbi:GNAT family N-acetyltransferase [Kineosporia sp. J2-2]|uniref:GNAT family N-acetyltransferase n=1 Tax=Kineosporia corallincola TaxID=2835133 RepID=A0ABS5TBE7_9ACTN|nr:GNAT family N-acetyltransferase [Kineosporia corallincola]MBT0768395.1 GNAT family N-acetyltransferase [Kineosporia corallincola]
MTGTILRRARPGDHDAVIDLHLTALRAAGADAGPGPWDDDLRDVLTHYAEFLVLTGLPPGETLIAMGALRRVDAITGEIKRMRTLPSHQGRGHGRTILTALEQRARTLGMRRLILDTTARQTAAVALYTGAGYRPFTTTVVAGLSSVVFEKPISPQ